MPTLDWIGKKAVVNHHREVPYRLIHCDGELSGGDPDAGNLLVQGDNLEALKSLLPYYAGKVKCIYIDPPFNTGSEDWIYNDNNTDPTIAAWLGKVVKGEDDDLTRHDKWLSMMYPRVRLLREFLTPDATLFLHIDDNELSYAIALFDEIFGRKNRIFVAAFKQGSATGHKSINPGCVNVLNNVIAYSKDRNNWQPNRVFTAQQRDKRYGSWIENFEDDFREWRIITLMKGFAASKGISVTEARQINKEEPEILDAFVLDNAEQVVQLARPDYANVGQETKDAIDASLASPDEYFRVERDGYSNIYLINGKRIIFYSDKVKVIDGIPVSGEPLTTLWDDLLSNNIHNEGGVAFPKGKKPEALIKRCLELATSTGDLVMDSFAGSGTTAAVAHKMNRKYLTVEMGEHAKTHVATRLQGVIEGSDKSGITNEVRWKGGGGFRFCTLGTPLFTEFGDIDGGVSFPDLAAHVFFSETGSPLPRKVDGSTRFIGTHKERAVYLLFSPAEQGFPREASGNVLTPDALAALPAPSNDFEGIRVVYAEGCTVSPERLKAAGVVFKQIPYQIEGN